MLLVSQLFLLPKNLSLDLAQLVADTALSQGICLVHGLGRALSDCYLPFKPLNFYRLHGHIRFILISLMHYWSGCVVNFSQLPALRAV